MMERMFANYSLNIVILTWAQLIGLLKSGQFGGLYRLQYACLFGLDVATEFDCTHKNYYCEVKLIDIVNFPKL
jgi:hypothetical protein